MRAQFGANILEVSDDHSFEVFLIELVSAILLVVDVDYVLDNRDDSELPFPESRYNVSFWRKALAARRPDARAELERTFAVLSTMLDVESSTADGSQLKFDFLKCMSL